LQFTTLESPAPTANEVLVKVRCTAINAVLEDLNESQ
jgi:NADPH:quinone reductase-like Zn-dependent oxidoreductase